MIVHFRTKKLENQYKDQKRAEKSYGIQVGRKYVLRINIIKQSNSVEELRNLPGLRCHPLKGDRKGQWSVSLTGFWRLIFTIRDRELQIVRIEEVSKHYDD